MTTLFWEWVRSEAALIDADGCSGPAAGFRVICCLEHDLGYYYQRDPREAYRNWRAKRFFYWDDASPITREEADRRFRVCLQLNSSLGKYSPLAMWRWLAVRIGGGSAWTKG